MPGRNCTCIHCGEPYNTMKSQAELRGFCSMRCQKLWEKDTLPKKGSIPNSEWFPMRLKKLNNARRETHGADQP